MSFPPTVSSSKHSARRSGFTLVEILVVIGIIGLILSIALPITFKARRQASKARATRDLEALRTGLEEFKNNHNEYPQIGFGGAVDGQHTLGYALTGINNVGAPIKDPKSARPYPALINIENFRVSGGRIQDSFLKDYLYFPARVPEPDIHVGSQYVNNTGLCMYNQANCPGTISLADMRKILGDNKTVNGRIDAGETESSTAPYLIWGAGPDGAYGLDPINNKSDDVTNFPVPVQYVR